MAATRIVLECRDEMWFREAPPRYGDVVYCQKCGDYKSVGDPQIRRGEVIHPDYDWKSYPDMSGECLVEGCGKRIKDTRFDSLRQRMELHHLRIHAGSRLSAPEMKRVPIPTKGSEPPF